MGKMWLRISARLNEIDEALLACIKLDVSQTPAKAFIAQPNPIGVDDITLAVFSNVANAPVAIIFLDFSSAGTRNFRLVALSWP
jgi:hypothetical protein